MTPPKKIVKDILVTYSDGSSELFKSRNPMICIKEEQYNKLSLFYEKYHKPIEAIKENCIIEELCEL